MFKFVYRKSWKKSSNNPTGIPKYLHEIFNNSSTEQVALRELSPYEAVFKKSSSAFISRVGTYFLRGQIKWVKKSPL